MQNHYAIKSAYRILADSILYFQGNAVGTVAAVGAEELAAANYAECFIRDFVPSALIFLADGRHDIVKNFLETTLALKTTERVLAGHEIQPGVMPASFRVEKNDNGEDVLRADFGEKAIGRVAPVDSMMWWIIILYIYTRITGDKSLAARPEFQKTMRQVMHLCLKDTFEVSPALLVPDACCMIDRRMGIHGYPIEIQALFYVILRIAGRLLDEDENSETTLLDTCITREHALRNYVRMFYWLDIRRLNEIHRYGTEEFGEASKNVLNIYPESIPEWVIDWLPTDSGYLVGNVGASRMDFRFFALGNLLSIIFSLTTDEQSASIMKLYEERWPDLVGDMPVKIIYPAMYGKEWHIRTGSDPKNMPWSYQNGGNWPVLLWFFVAAALKTGRGDLAERAYHLAENRLLQDNWPEYYDGHIGRLIGRRANYKQVWSAASLILSNKLLENPGLLDFMPR